MATGNIPNSPKRWMSFWMCWPPSPNGSYFGVQYDPSNAIVAGDDPIELLRHVADRVVSMHASDRYLADGRHPGRSAPDRRHHRLLRQTAPRRHRPGAERLRHHLPHPGRRRLRRLGQHRRRHERHGRNGSNPAFPARHAGKIFLKQRKNEHRFDGSDGSKRIFLIRCNPFDPFDPCSISNLFYTIISNRGMMKALVKYDRVDKAIEVRDMPEPGPIRPDQVLLGRAGRGRVRQRHPSVAREPELGDQTAAGAGP